MRNNSVKKFGIHKMLCFLQYIFPVFFTVCFLILNPSSLNAAYTLHLKNGRIITGVDEITEERGTVRILKGGISLTIQQDSIAKIEESESVAEEADRLISPPPQTGGELPAYQQYDDRAREEREIREQEIKNLESRYNDVVQKLEEIKVLEEKSRELQWESREKWSPRKARIAKQEKAEIDKKLEGLEDEKADLLKEKQELEFRIGR